MDKVAIVTSSDSGIGKATAVRLARDGFDIGITWHEDEPGAKETAEKVTAEGRQAAVRRPTSPGFPRQRTQSMRSPTNSGALE